MAFTDSNFGLTNVLRTENLDYFLFRGITCNTSNTLTRNDLPPTPVMVLSRLGDASDP